MASPVPSERPVGYGGVRRRGRAGGHHRDLGDGGRARAVGLHGELGLEALERLGEGLEMAPLAFHGEGEGVGGLLVALGEGLADHHGVDGGGLLGLALDDGAEVLGGGGEVAGDAEVVHAVDGLGTGDFLEDLGDLGVALLQGAVGVGVVLQVGEGLGDDGVPEVPLGPGERGRVGGHGVAPVRWRRYFSKYIVSRKMGPEGNPRALFTKFVDMTVRGQPPGEA